MKKTFLFIFISIAFNFQNFVNAQNLSIEEAQKILVGEKWLLIKLEQDNKVLKVPSELEGKRMVFKPNGYVYHFMPSEIQAEKANTGFRWSITKTQLSIGYNLVYSYSLKDIDGMKLYLTRPGEPTFVYERDRKLSTDEYDDFYVSSPKADSSMKELFARIKIATADNKNIINSGPARQKIDGKWVFEKMNLSGYIIYFDDSNKDMENLIKAWIRMTGAEGDQDSKNDINKNKGLIYAGLKEIYKSSIEFKDMKYDQVFKGAAGDYTRNTGKLVFNEQGDDGKTGKKEVSFRITTSDYDDDGYNILYVEVPQDFHDENELKVKINNNSLVLEKVESTDIEGDFKIIDEENMFILYFKKK
jgi:hypothetical protein